MGTRASGTERGWAGVGALRYADAETSRGPQSRVDFGLYARDFVAAHPEASHKIDLAKNEILYTSGERSQGIYLVEHGAVKTISHSQVGKDCLLDIYVSWELLGESSLAGRTRAETAVAMMPSRLVYVGSDAFMEHLLGIGCMNDWAQYLVMRLRERQETITSLVTVDSERCLAATLLRLAVRLGTTVNGMRRIDVRITHQELSEMVGTTRSRVGVFLKGFVAAGMVSMGAGGAMLVDEPRLRRYVDNGGSRGLLLAAER